MIFKIFGIIIAALSNALAIWAFYEAFYTSADKALLSVVFGGPLAAVIAGAAVLFLGFSGWINWYWGLIVIPVIVGIIGFSFFLR